MLYVDLLTLPLIFFRMYFDSFIGSEVNPSFLLHLCLFIYFFVHVASLESSAYCSFYTLLASSNKQQDISFSTDSL